MKKSHYRQFSFPNTLQHREEKQHSIADLDFGFSHIIYIIPKPEAIMLMLIYCATMQRLICKAAAKIPQKTTPNQNPSKNKTMHNKANDLDLARTETLHEKG